MFILKSTFKVPLFVAFTRPNGSEAPVDGAPVWASSDPGVVFLEVAEDGMSAVAVATGVPGQVQISVRGDSAIGEEFDEVLGLFDIEVVEKELVVATITAGVQVPQ